MVVITGASAGVGRATVRAFARQRADIGLLARGRDGLEAAKREVEELGGRALVLPTDVADPDQVEAAAAAVDRAFGPVDVWVNNAMVSVFSPVKLMKPEEYRRVTEVTYLGYVYGTLAALRRMLPRDEGIIIQVGSALAYRGIPLQSAYCAAKHAIQGFCDSLHAELIHDGSRVRLTMVQMPALNTPQFGWVKSRLPRKAAAGPADLPARGRRRGDRLGGRPRPPRALSSAGRRSRRSSATRSRRAGSTITSPATAIDSQMTDEPEDPDRPDNLWRPLPATTGPTAASTTAPARRAGSSGPTRIAAGWPPPAAASPASPSRPSRPALAGALRPVPSADNMTPVPGEGMVCRTSCRIRRFPLRSGRVVSGDRWRRWWSIGWKVGLVLLIAWGLLRPWYAYSRWKQSGQAGNRTAQWNGHLSSDEHSGSGGDRSRPAE